MKLLLLAPGNLRVIISPKHASFCMYVAEFFYLLLFLNFGTYYRIVLKILGDHLSTVDAIS